MARKTNPRRIPATMADVNRAKRETTDAVMKRMLEMFIYAMKDIGAPDETVDLVMEKFRYTVDGINRGDIDWKDVSETLHSEYDISFDFT